MDPRTLIEREIVREEKKVASIQDDIKEMLNQLAQDCTHAANINDSELCFIMGNFDTLKTLKSSLTKERFLISTLKSLLDQVDYELHTQWEKLNADK